MEQTEARWPHKEKADVAHLNLVFLGSQTTNPAEQRATVAGNVISCFFILYLQLILFFTNNSHNPYF